MSVTVDQTLLEILVTGNEHLMYSYLSLVVAKSLLYAVYDQIHQKLLSTYLDSTNIY